MVFKIAVNPASSNENILRLYKPVLILLQFCGFDFKVFKYSYIFQIIVKVYGGCLLMAVAYATFMCCITQQIHQIWSLLEYMFCVVILMIYNSKLTYFFHNLSKIDIYLRINKKHYSNDKNKTFIFTVVLWLVRIVYCAFYFFYFPSLNKTVFYMISQFSLLALDMSRVWRYIILDAVRYRLKILRIRLEDNPESNYYLYIKDKKSYKEDKIRFCLYLYRRIADMVDLITPELMHASIFASIICSLPKLIINVYHILLVIEGHEPYDAVGFVIMHICQLCFFLFSPCIVVELYGMEVDRMKLFLMHRLIDETDLKIKEEVELFLQYTSIRTFRYRIWRCIPLNISLPMEIANFCTSYVIVLINFNHLYG